MPVAPSVSDVATAIGERVGLNSTLSTRGIETIDLQQRYFASGGLRKRYDPDHEFALGVLDTYTFINDVGRFVCYAIVKQVGLRHVQANTFQVELIENSSRSAQAIRNCPVGKLMSINRDIFLLVNHNGGHIEGDAETQITVWYAAKLQARTSDLHLRLGSWADQLQRYMRRIAVVPQLEVHRPALQRELDRLETGAVVLASILGRTPQPPFSGEDQRRFEILLLEMRVFEPFIEAASPADAPSLKMLHADWQAYQKARAKFQDDLDKFRWQIGEIDQFTREFPDEPVLDEFRQHLAEAEVHALRYSEDERFTLDLPSLQRDLQECQDLFNSQMTYFATVLARLRVEHEDAVALASREAAERLARERLEREQHRHEQREFEWQAREKERQEKTYQQLVSPDRRGRVGRPPYSGSSDWRQLDQHQVGNRRAEAQRRYNSARTNPKEITFTDAQTVLSQIRSRVTQIEDEVEISRLELDALRLRCEKMKTDRLLTAGVVGGGIGGFLVGAFMSLFLLGAPGLIAGAVVGAQVGKSSVESEDKRWGSLIGEIREAIDGLSSG